LVCNLTIEFDRQYTMGAGEVLRSVDFVADWPSGGSGGYPISLTGGLIEDVDVQQTILTYTHSYGVVFTSGTIRNCNIHVSVTDAANISTVGAFSGEEGALHIASGADVDNISKTTLQISGTDFSNKTNGLHCLHCDAAHATKVHARFIWPTAQTAYLPYSANYIYKNFWSNLWNGDYTLNTSNSVYHPINSGDDQLTVTVVDPNTTVHVHCTFSLYNGHGSNHWYGHPTITRDSTIITWVHASIEATKIGLLNLQCEDQPGVGTFTYKLTLRNDTQTTPVSSSSRSRVMTARLENDVTA